MCSNHPIPCACCPWCVNEKYTEKVSDDEYIIHAIPSGRSGFVPLGLVEKQG